MALGGLRGNNLNTILTAGGRVAELLAEEMGVTTLELRKLGKEGKLTGDVILRALIGNMEALREEADKMPATIGDAFVRIGNAVQRLVGSFDQFFGASESVAGVLVSLSTQIGRLMSYVTAAIVGFGTRFVASLVAARMATLTLSGALATLRGALVRTGIGALIVGAGELIYQFSKLVSATGSFGGALRVLGDIAGSVWTFIVEAAGAIPDGLRSVWDQVKADFLQMVQSLQVAWGQFVAGLGADLQSRRFSRFGAFKGMAEDMQNAGLDIQKSAYESQQAIDDLATSAGKAGERAAGAVSAAVGKLSSDVSAALEGAKKVSDELGQALPLPPDLAGGAGAGAGAKKGGRKGTQERPFFESVQAELVNLQRQIQLIGKTKEESAALQARWQMLDEAKRRGIPINETLNAQIDSYASRVGRLTGELERAEIAQQQFDQAVDGIADAFAGALVAGESLREGLAQVFKQIASDLMRSGLRNAISGLFGGGSGGGFLGLRIPGFATGGRHGGGWRVVGEGGAELEATGPARYFTAAQTRQMLAGGGGGGAMDIHITASFDETGNLYVKQVAQQEAASMGAEINRGLPARVQQINANPRRR